MTLSMRRIVLFTKDMPGMVKFYRDVLGTSQVGRRPPKIGFWAKDIGAARQELVGRGAKMSKVMEGGGLARCEGVDPDGNPFSISDRV